MKTSGSLYYDEHVAKLYHYSATQAAPTKTIEGALPPPPPTSENHNT